MDPGLLSLVQCPACRERALESDARGLACASCEHRFSSESGFVDLLDISRGEPTPSSPEQQLMESELIARLYERFWRPTFVRVVAGRGASARTGGFPGEFFIHKNALAMEDRHGPWLDLSCGPGTFTRAMAAVAPGDRVVGLDISRAMLEVAAKKARGYGNISLVRGDAHELPFVDGAFGGVNNTGALHVYDDPDAVFSEILRVLRPGGVYVGSTFAEAQTVVGGLTAKIAGIRRFGPPELRAWLSRVGFADYEEIRLEGAFIFRARKP